MLALCSTMPFALAPQSKNNDANSIKTSTPAKYLSNHIYNNSSLYHTFQLQRTIGSHAEQTVLHSNIGGFNFGRIGILQPKLKVSQPGDAYEQEGDRVADQVIRMADRLYSGTPEATTKGEELIDRKRSAYEMREEQDKELKISRNSSPSSNLETNDETMNEISNARSSGGSALDPDTKEFMESRFGGYDFSTVRIHTGENAERSSTSVNALAYTVENDIVFGAGYYQPHTIQGRSLLAHELAHVVQQGPGASIGGQAAVQRLALALDYEKGAREINEAVEGLGTDEEAIYRVLRQLQRDPESVSELEATYARLFSESLMDALEDDLSHDELDYAKGLMGKPVAVASVHRVETAAPLTPTDWDAQARRLKSAVEHRTLGIFGGTDEEAIFAVLTPLAGDANKIEQIKQAYARVTGGPSTALADALREEMSGSELTYALQLLAVPDPHAGTQTGLSSAQVLAIRNELIPTTAVSSGAPALWDGRFGAPDWAAKRAALKADLLADLRAHLDCVMPDITPLVTAPRLPMTKLEGAANAAVEVTDDEYKSWYGVSAVTPTQAGQRAGFHFSSSLPLARRNLLDANDPAVRASLRTPISARSVAHWIVGNDIPNPDCPPRVGAVEHSRAHNFNPEGELNGEMDWLDTNVITPFINMSGNALKLRQYDQFGFAIQPQPGKIMLTSALVGSSLASGGAPNMRDRRFLWSTWHVAVHEYLHNLLHPASERAVQGTVMREGFTEYFTKGVLKKVAPVAHMNKGLVAKVEGGIFSPPTTQDLVGPYTTAGDYAANLAHVENLASIVPGGDNALRAYYFQGHVEMLGIDPTTHTFITSAPSSVDPTLVNIPAGMADLDDLAVRSGVPRSEILAANSGLTATGPLPPKLRLPGVREHRIAATVVPTGIAPTETAEQIAAQNGVSVTALQRANPSVAWGSLTRGQLILIPRH